MKAQKIHPYDGTVNAGQPEKEVFKVINLVRHRPVDGKSQGMICVLDDNTWHFDYNLKLFTDEGKEI